MNKYKVMTGEIVVDSFSKKVTPSGSSGHIPVAKKHVGAVAKVQIIKKWMICQRCSQTFTDQKNFSPNTSFCRDCYEAVEFLKEKKGNLKCKKCKKKISEREYKDSWNQEICSSCLLKEMDNDGMIIDRDILHKNEKYGKFVKDKKGEEMLE